MRRNPCYLTAEIVQIAGVHEFVQIAISRLAKYFQDYDLLVRCAEIISQRIKSASSSIHERRLPNGGMPAARYLGTIGPINNLCSCFISAMAFWASA